MLLYHGTSRYRYEQMKQSGFVSRGPLYISDDPETSEMYASYAVEADEDFDDIDHEDNALVLIVLDGDKLVALNEAELGELGPDWDDVEDNLELFDDAVSANEVPWYESLEVIGTCTYFGPFGDAIVDVSIV